MKKGGMGAQFFAVYVSSSYTEGNHSAKRALDMIDTVKHDIIAKYPGDFMFATTAADVREAHRQHNRGHLSRRRQDVPGCAGDQQSADLRVALFLPRDLERAAKYDR
jgi:hypothetical protein